MPCYVEIVRRRLLELPSVCVLFCHRDGSVTAEVIGPTEGFRWTKVLYFRFERSTKEAGKWERRTADRERDQIHLSRCNEAVRGYFNIRKSRAA